MEGLQSHPLAQGSAPVSTSVPALMAGANERSLTSADTSEQRSYVGRFVIPTLTDASKDGYSAALYANALSACRDAGKATVRAIAAMAIYCREHAPRECVTEAKGPRAMQFWRDSNTRLLVKHFGSGMGRDDGTASKYLRVAVGVAWHTDFASVTEHDKTLAQGEASLVAWLMKVGGTYRTMATLVGVKVAKDKAEADPERDPNGPATEEEKAEADKASAARVKRLNGSLTTEERAGVITLAAVEAWARGVVVGAEQEEAFERLASLIVERIDVSREDREAKAEAEKKAAAAAHSGAITADAARREAKAEAEKKAAAAARREAMAG